jgi:phage-related protein
MAEKPLAWLESSLDDVRAFPVEGRRAAEYQLGRVQQGLLPDDWKPMTTVGAGVHEIRVHTDLEHRVFYVAKYASTSSMRSKSARPTRETPTSPWRASVWLSFSVSENGRRRLGDSQGPTI